MATPITHYEFITIGVAFVVVMVVSAFCAGGWRAVDAFSGRSSGCLCTRWPGSAVS
jgi:hypothetical protein